MNIIEKGLTKKDKYTVSMKTLIKDGMTLNMPDIQNIYVVMFKE
jgi:hypothetical protein